jgi:hypothetical protein
MLLILNGTLPAFVIRFSVLKRPISKLAALGIIAPCWLLALYLYWAFVSPKPGPVTSLLSAATACSFFIFIQKSRRRDVENVASPTTNGYIALSKLRV